MTWTWNDPSPSSTVHNGGVGLADDQIQTTKYASIFHSATIQIPKHVFLIGVYVVLILCRWDQRSSVVTPDEDIFYLVALLRSALDTGDETHTLEHLTNQNRQILKFCDDAGIKVKQYLPHYTTQEEWMDHFGDKWGQFYQRKMDFDPRRILATGQRIFSPSSSVSFSNHGADKLLSIS